MRYFIGALIRGETAEYYKATCSELARQFGIDDLSTIMPAYMTVKAPFDRTNIEPVIDLVSKVAEAPAHPLSLSGLSNFDRRTIFVDAPNPSPELTEYLKGVLTKLRAFGLPVNPREDKLHLHLSIARFIKPPQYESIWKYLNASPAPSFDINFDNLTIFVKETEASPWKVLKTFPLLGKR